MKAFEQCMARPMEARDLEPVLAWRNHPDVRRFMLTQHEIPLDEHRRWFERASCAPDKRLLMVEEYGIQLGFVHFSGVADGGIAEWGFYTVPHSPKGTGRKLGTVALDYAFEELKLHKVGGQVLRFNEASLRFHTALGFTQEGVLRKQVRIGGAYQDLICFGLLSQEWTGRKE